MGSKIISKYIVFSLFVGLLLGCALAGPLGEGSGDLMAASEADFMEPMASTNPSSPTYLSDDYADSESYSSSLYYYYRTSTASTYYYHVVWLQPYYSNDDFDLSVYSDSSYSNFVASSIRGDGLLDWVVFRPSSYQYYYPRVLTYDAGSAYIEWEDSSTTISVKNSVSAYLSSSEAIEIFEVSLSSSKEYDITLKIPSGLDADLYLYYLNQGSGTSYSGYFQCSKRTGSGVDEKIDDYSPTISGDYAIIIARSSGSGSATLEFNYAHDLIPVIITIVVLIVISGILAMAVVIYKKSSRVNPQAHARRGGGQAGRRVQTGASLQPRQTTRQVIQSSPATMRMQHNQVSRPTPQMPLPVNPVEEVVKCPFCDHANQKGDLFCRNCGSELW